MDHFNILLRGEREALKGSVYRKALDWAVTHLDVVLPQLNCGDAVLRHKVASTLTLFAIEQGMDSLICNRLEQYNTWARSALRSRKPIRCPR